MTKERITVKLTEHRVCWRNFGSKFSRRNQVRMDVAIIGRRDRGSSIGNGRSRNGNRNVGLECMNIFTVNIIIGIFIEGWICRVNFIIRIGRIPVLVRRHYHMRDNSIFMCGVWSHLDGGETLTDGKRKDITVVGGDALYTSSKDGAVINPVM